MELNDIKKQLYKSKPIATLGYIRKDGLLYATYVENDRATDLKFLKEPIYFLVPLSEIGESTFIHEMPAQLLIRYIITTEPTY